MTFSIGTGQSLPGAFLMNSWRDDTARDVKASAVKKPEFFQHQTVRSSFSGGRTQRLVTSVPPILRQAQC